MLTVYKRGIDVFPASRLPASIGDAIFALLVYCWQVTFFNGARMTKIISLLLELNMNFKKSMNQLGYGKATQFMAYAGIPLILVGCPYMLFSAGSSNKAVNPGAEKKSELIASCAAYKAARSECAAASNVSNCVEIKIGTTAAYMASSTYCDSEGNPNLWLLPKSQQ